MFAGYELSNIEKTNNQNVTNNILAGVAVILLFSITGYYIIRKYLKKPLTDVKGYKANEKEGREDSVYELSSIKIKDEMEELSSSISKLFVPSNPFQKMPYLTTAAAAQDLSVSVSSEN
jgi:hypothetical protein